LLFLPYLTGERTPHPDPYARGTFFGLTLRHTKEHFVRATLEGVSYGLRDQFEILRELGVDVNHVRFSGGGSKSPVWTQINADIVGKTHASLGIDEGPALGAALLAAVGVGAYSTVADACRESVRITTKTEPRPENVAVYNNYYPVFKSLYPALKPAFEATAKLSL
jgi:xylulokinase